MNSLFEKCSPLPLTPALSLRERENHTPSPMKSCGRIHRTTSRAANRSRPLFPLPGGEGQGEGGRHH